MRSSEITLSVVIPMHNEESSIEALYKRLQNVLSTVQETYEIVFVDDGSTDTTVQIVTRMTKKNPHLRLIKFARNFGKEIALTAGVTRAKGKAIIMMDADGQHPPELIPDFLATWRKGYSMVVGIRQSNKKEGFVKKYGSKIYYKIFNLGKHADQKVMPGSTDYRLMDWQVRREFLRFTERNRITRGLLDWLGFKKAYVTFDSSARQGGEAAYRFNKLAKLGVDSYISSGATFLYTLGWIGLCIATLAVIGGVAIFIQQWILGDPLGWRITNAGMLSVGLFFFIGMVLVSQGVTAFYISHIHSEVQNRPLYVIDEAESIKL